MYGPIEHTYCEPVADALASNSEFAKWFLDEIGAGAWAGRSQCLSLAQAKARKYPRFWWKNNYCHETRCTCLGLAGRELDILAVFERDDGRRLAVHIECKHPKDFFSPNQALGYPVRARCWGSKGNNPPRVLDHHEAMTVILTDVADRHDDADVACFDAVMTFEQVGMHISPYPGVFQI